MRFTLLPIGDRFEYQNERYSKNGPLTAVNLENNRQRMIPRSALVVPLSTVTDETETVPTVTTTFDAETVTAAFSQYHETCLRLLLQEEKDKTALMKTLEQARQRFFVACGMEKS